MKHFRTLLTVAVLAYAPMVRAGDAGPSDECLQPGDSALLKDGCAALDDFMRTFNSRDGKAWAATLQFPHVRVAGNLVQIWDTAEDYARSNDVAELAKSQGWHHTAWTTRRLVQQSPDKLHFVVQFTRFGADDTPLGTYDSFYIVTKKDGRWGTQLRSSYAGAVGKKTAF